MGLAVLHAAASGNKRWEIAECEAFAGLGERLLCTLAHMSTAKRDSCKQSLYFPMEMLDEIRHQAKRLDRSLSWVIQRAWMVAKTEIRRMPGSEGR